MIETKTYQMKSTSDFSGTFSPLILQETEQIRLVLTPEYVRHDKDSEPRLKFCFSKERKSTKDTWIKDNPNPQLKIGELRNLRLDSEATLKFIAYLDDLRAIVENQGFQYGDKSFHVSKSNEVIFADTAQQSKVINHLIKNAPLEILEELAKIDSSEASRFAHFKIAAERKQSLLEFEDLLKTPTIEKTWQQFFEKNDWIFGYGLKYQFLNLEEANPYLGGKNTANQNGEISDYLLSTAASEAKFTVLVEIKTAQTPLQYNKHTRNNVYFPSTYLSAAVSQVQINAQTWYQEGSKVNANRKYERKNVLTILPKAVLIIGHTNMLENDEQKRSFEIYRQNLNSPDIITFDELFERAKFIIECQTQAELNPSVSTEDPFDFDDENAF